jgi:hypothetical protein
MEQGGVGERERPMPVKTKATRKDGRQSVQRRSSAATASIRILAARQRHVVAATPICFALTRTGRRCGTHRSTVVRPRGEVEIVSKTHRCRYRRQQRTQRRSSGCYTTAPLAAGVQHHSATLLCSALLCCVGEYGGPSLRRRRLPCRTSAAEGAQRIVKQRRSLLLPRCLPIHFRCFALRCAASQFGGTDNIGSAPLAAAGPQFTRLVQACPAAVPERAPVSVPVPMSLFRGDDEG